MAAFEKRIREQQQRPYRSTEHLWPRHKMGDFICAVLAITDKDEAGEFYREYVRWIELQADKNTRYTPEQVARLNIGWCFGEGMRDEEVRMWTEVCGAVHPIFGTKLPAPEEALQAGIAQGVTRHGY